MTKAIVSGRLRIAVFGDALPRYVVYRDKPDDKIEISPNEARYLLRDATDPEYYADIDALVVRDQLELASDSSEALDLVLILLDRNLSTETRECAASELDELIAHDRVVDRLQQLLYAQPLPQAADMEGALRAAGTFSRVSQFLGDLRDEQPSIKTVRDAWNVVPFDDGMRKDAESTFLAHGVFASFAKAITTGVGLREVALQLAQNTALESDMPALASALEAWIKCFPSELPRTPSRTVDTPADGQRIANAPLDEPAGGADPTNFDVWIREAREGSSEAFGKLFAECQRYLWMTAQGMIPPTLRGKVDAEDLLQETFLQAHRHFADFAGTHRDELLAWLRRILLNNAVNACRQYEQTQKRNVAREVITSGDTDFRRLASDTPEPISVLISVELQQQLDQALQRLPAEMRTVILLRARDHFSFAQIGEHMQRSEASARKLWMRAIERLQQVQLDSSG